MVVSLHFWRRREEWREMEGSGVTETAQKWKPGSWTLSSSKLFKSPPLPRPGPSAQTFYSDPDAGPHLWMCLCANDLGDQRPCLTPQWHRSGQAPSGHPLVLGGPASGVCPPRCSSAVLGNESIHGTLGAWNEVETLRPGSTVGSWL